MATLIAMLIRLRLALRTVVCANERGGARALKTPLSRIAAAKSHCLVTGLLRALRLPPSPALPPVFATVTRMRYEMSIVVACDSRQQACGRKRHHESVGSDG